MRRVAFQSATALTRAWVRLYTWRMARPAAQARRAEIESDMWEMQRDAASGGGSASPTIALLRLLTGMPADFAWRFEQAPVEEQLLLRRFVALGAAGAVVVAIWTIPARLAVGRRQVETCAATVAPPQTTADLRHEIIRCAGTFFSAAR